MAAPVVLGVPIVLRLAGTFKPNKKLYGEARKAEALNIELFERTKASGVLRSDIEVADIALLFEQLAAIRIGSARRTALLRQRYLTLLFDALRAAGPTALPGPSPTLDEVNSRWDTS